MGRRLRVFLTFSMSPLALVGCHSETPICGDACDSGEPQRDASMDASASDAGVGLDARDLANTSPEHDAGELDAMSAQGDAGESGLLPGQAGPIRWNDLLDFLVQNVCLDSSGSVVMGISPADGDPRCISQRDIGVGERIPYYLAMSAVPAILERYPTGLHRQAFVPHHFPMLDGTAVLRIFDSTRIGEYGVRDYSDTPIRSLWLQTPQTISLVGASDFEGPRLFIGNACVGNVEDPSSRLNAAMVINRELLRAVADGIPERSALFSSIHHWRGTSRYPGPCSETVPTEMTIDWQWTTRRFLSAFGTAVTPPMTALVHNRQPANASQPHIERTYYTRELGLTRWENWENLSAPANQARAAALRAQAAEIEAANVCNDLSGEVGDRQLARPPSAAGNWVTIGCYESTNTLPPDDAVMGDDPASWIEHISRSPLFASLFGIAPAPAPTITRIVPAMAQPGASVEIRGTNLGSVNSVSFDQALVPGSIGTSTAGGRVITFEVPTMWQGLPFTESRTFALKVYNDEIVAHSPEVDFTVVPP